MTADQSIFTLVIKEKRKANALGRSPSRGKLKCTKVLPFQVQVKNQDVASDYSTNARTDLIVSTDDLLVSIITTEKIPSQLLLKATTPKLGPYQNQTKIQRLLNFEICSTFTENSLFVSLDFIPEGKRKAVN